MSAAVVESTVREILDRLDADLSELAAVSLTPVPDDELLAVCQRLETLRNRFAPVDHVLVNEVDRRGLAFRHGYRRTADLLRQLLRIHPGDAAGRVAAAQVLGPICTLTGEQLDPVFPATAAAQAEGAISPRHAAVIVATVDGLPAEVRAELDRTVEAILLDTARVHDPRILGGAGP